MQGFFDAHGAPIELKSHDVTSAQFEYCAVGPENVSPNQKRIGQLVYHNQRVSNLDVENDYCDVDLAENSGR